MLRIASINLNKRLGNNKVKMKLEKWLDENSIDLLLTQEPWVRDKDYDLEIKYFDKINGNDSVRAWIRRKWSIVNSKLMVENIQEINVDYLRILNVYFSAYQSEDRIKTFQKLDSFLEGKKEQTVIIIGDFNFAPKPDDGIINKLISNFNSIDEREAYNSFIKKNKLEDYSEKFIENDQTRFTIERSIGNNFSQFRCDLVLTNTYYKYFLKGYYDHKIRINDEKFTDHSAILLEVPIDLEQSENVPLDLFEDINNVTGIKKQIYFPHKTAIPRTEPSSVAKVIIKEKELIKKNVKILDYGCGYGTDVMWYKSLGYYADGWDPSEKFGFNENPPFMNYNIVTCVFVLNVLPNPYERLDTLKKASEYLSNNGHLIIATRSKDTIEKEAILKNWKKHNDGYWSSLQKLTFQKGINVEEIKVYLNHLEMKIEPITSQLDKISETTLVVAKKIR